MSAWFSRILLLLALLLSLVFGMLNGTIIELDFGFSRWNLPLGVALLAFLLMGTLLGATAAYFTFVPRIKMQLRELKKVSNKA